MDADMKCIPIPVPVGKAPPSTGKTPPVTGKTPATCLQEICLKRGFTPQYTIVNIDGPVHKPTFQMQAVVEKFSATGEGTSKKAAKQAASDGVLQLMAAGGNIEQLMRKEEKLQLDFNVVGRLQELTHKLHWPLPRYEFTAENGPAHRKEFICVACVMQVSEQGVGSSKKLAKRAAATALLAKLKGATEYATELANQDGGLETEYLSLVRCLREESGITSITKPENAAIQKLYHGLRQKMGKTLASLQTMRLNIPATNYCQMLNEIAEEQRLEITYLDIGELTLNGLHQCLVKMSSSQMPIAVCHACGRSKDEAHALAAHNSLQYLKVITQKD